MLLQSPVAATVGGDNAQVVHHPSLSLSLSLTEASYETFLGEIFTAIHRSFENSSGDAIREFSLSLSLFLSSREGNLFSRLKRRASFPLCTRTGSNHWRFCGIAV